MSDLGASGGLPKGKAMTGSSGEMPIVAPTSRWRIHDAIVGLLAGAGAGGWVGAVASIRWFDNHLATLFCALVGAVLGILMLRRSHERHDGFVTAAVVAMWVTLVGSGVLITALALAVMNFS